jgi:hypothetical protein
LSIENSRTWINIDNTVTFKMNESQYQYDR